MAAVPRTCAVTSSSTAATQRTVGRDRTRTMLHCTKQTAPLGNGWRVGVWAAPVRWLLFVLVVALFAACPGPSPVDCRVGADCVSGVCLGDGTCEPARSGADAGTDGGDLPGTDGGPVTADAGHDAGTNDAGVDAGSPVGCLPNHDGTILRSEVAFQAGLRATFRISGTATFDTAGAASADGGRSWDFTAMLAGDTSRLVETKPVQGEWYESEFPDAGYVSELGQGSNLLGVFSTTDDGLYLQGVVSPSDGVTSTRLRYQPWVKVLQFPLAPAASWETNTTVSGRYNGLVIGFNLPFQTERYQMAVDRSGDAKTPFATFPSLRVRTIMTRSLNTVPTLTVRSFSWNTECFGTIATVTSTDNESSTEFTDVAEARRLSP